LISEEYLRKLCARNAVRITAHIVKRCGERGISLEQVYQALVQGSIIKQYPEDKPYPSCLVLRNAAAPLHVVVSASEGELYVVTAYSPAQLLTKWAVKKGTAVDKQGRKG